MPVYTAYILRIWRVRHGHSWECRAQLERVATGNRIGFADLESLVAYLQADVEHSGLAQESPDTDSSGRGTRAPDDAD